MSYYYHQTENCTPAVEMATACEVHYLMVSSVLAVVVEIVKDKMEHYCDDVPLCLFETVHVTKHSNITITYHVVVSAAATVELDSVTTKIFGGKWKTIPILKFNCMAVFSCSTN